MRKIMAFMAVFVLSIALVSAYLRPTYDENTNTATFQIEKAGWYILPMMAVREGSCLKDSKLTYAWIWSPTMKKYIGGKYDTSIDSADNQKLIDDSNNYYAYAHEMFGGAWAYITGECSIGGSYDLERYKWFRDNTGKLQLAKGWNLFTVTPVMWDKSFNDIKGDCKITAIAGWDGSKQEWMTINGSDVSIAMTSRAEKKSATGESFWFKAENDCIFDFNPVVQPPPIPIIPE